MPAFQSGPVARLGLDEFRHATRSALLPAPRTAVFDCDGTLWGGDAGWGFMTWSIEAGLLSRDASNWIAERHRLYRDGQVSELEICGEMVQVYAGLREDEMRRAASRYFATHVEPQIFPEMRALVADLQNIGAEIWAVSSTNNWVIEEGVRRFGIALDHVFAARVKVADGLVTGELIDVPTDEGKAAALRGAGILRPDAVFGNSIHDAAMLEMAVSAFPVNPTPALVEIARQRGWSIFYPAAVLADHTK